MSDVQKQNHGNRIWDLIEKIMDVVLRKILHLKLNEKQWDGRV